MVGFVILLIVMVGIWVLLLGAVDTSEISKNWPQYRCQPTVMPFASFFGHDTSENFNFCLKGIMNNTAGPLLSPIFTIFGSILGVLANLMNVANSLRVQFASFLGGINTIFQNFTDRFKQLTFKIQMTATQMKQLIGRLYATFFALIYMSMSGIRALQNFSNTTLFKFMDTFCFDPDTPVHIEGKGMIPLKEVKIGDVFEKTGSRVTSTFRFHADGQPMVQLPGVLVSTNHYIEHNNSWIRADQHPDSIPTSPWNGGSLRPLICLNTSDHHIPIGNYVFADYDETEEADDTTMKWVEHRLNAKSVTDKTKGFAYTTVLSPETELRMSDQTVRRIDTIKLDEYTSLGKVIGLVKKEVSEVCSLDSGERVSPGQLMWDAQRSMWTRVGDQLPIQRLETPEIFYSMITSGQTIETKSGQFFRDYVEVHSPEAEQFYAQAMTMPSSTKSE
jgi:hypothetical protein